MFIGGRRQWGHIQPRKQYLLEFAAKKKKKNKFKKFRNIPASKEKDLSAGCLLRAPPRGESFFISINPYTRRGDVREVLLSSTKLKLLCSSYFVPKYHEFGYYLFSS